jgi:hypothetical protein
MSGTKEIQTGSNAARGALRRATRYAIASSVTAGVFLSVAALAPAAQAATANAAASSPAKATARIQALLDSPAGGTVNLPRGTFTIRPTLRLKHGERIVGHGTTLRLAPGSGDYNAMLAGASQQTDLSGLTITGVTFDQNNSGNPIHSVAKLYKGAARFVLLLVTGTGIKITNDRFIGCDNVNTIVTGEATRKVLISGNVFKKTLDAPMHDHSSIYTSGIGTVIRNNTFTGRAAYATAIEVHSDKVTVTGNHVRGYYKAANIGASDVTFTGNHVSHAANPVDLWSTAPAATRNVTVTGNVLNRDRAYWKKVLASLGRSMPAPRYTRQVIREAVSTLPFYNITVHGNHA